MRSYDFCLSVVNGVFLSACADAYLTPCIQNYVKGFASGFKDKVRCMCSLKHAAESKYLLMVIPVQ